MSDSSARSLSEQEEDGGRSPTEAELDELRHLLLAPEQTQIVELRERLNDPRFNVEDVSRVLPEAVTLRSGKDKQLTRALMPTVQDALTISVKRDPQRLVDIIFPVLGPAIRKAISSALGEMVQSINQTLEHSLSVESLKWRFEAYRTGKPLAELVLFHKLIYQVEQVFLVHKRTGVVLLHVERDAGSALDADLMSAMLTALEDFAHDTIRGSREGALEDFKVGDYLVWVEQRTLVILAAIIRGEPPEEFRRVLEDAALNIQREQYDELEAFDGDTSPFEASRIHLEDCLQQQLKSKKKTSPLLWIAPALLMLGLGVWLFFTIRDDRRWSDYVEKLKSNPGIIVVSDEERGGKRFIYGLRDPLAIDPATLFNETRVDPAEVVSRWEPYQAVYPQFVVVRAERLLEPPKGVRLRFEDNTLYAGGVAPRDWITEARRLARAVPGVDQFQEENLIDETELESLKREVESITITFVTGSAELSPDQGEAVERAASGLRKLSDYFQSAGKTIRVEVLGFADKTGTDELNARLSRERADRVFSALASGGISQADLSPKGMGVKSASPADGPGQGAASLRSVIFRVTLPDLTAGN